MARTSFHKRRRLRAYTTHGGKSLQYKKLRCEFDLKLENEARKYRLKIENEVKEGKRGPSYKAIRKLGLRPGESWNRADIILPAYVEQNFTPLQAANKLAEYFSSISQSVDPLNEGLMPPVVREALEDGRSSSTKPVLTHHQVYCKMKRVKKP